MSVLNQLCLKTFGLAGSAIVVSYTPQDDSGTQTIDGIIQNPNVYEDNTPGGAPGTTVVRLFVPSYGTLTPRPAKGDKIVIDGTEYFILRPDADLTGGAVLLLRGV